MRNAKLLRDTAQREANDAESHRKLAAKLQAKADEFKRAGDMSKSLEQSKAAQDELLKADQFSQAASESQKEAAALETKVIEDIDRKIQEVQEHAQAELERLEGERKRLLGE